MLYILRLSSGGCVISLAPDEQSARCAALELDPVNGAEIVSVRPLDRFSFQVCPTDDGSFEVNRWDDAAAEDILAHEYPVLYEAYCRANAEPFAKARPEAQILMHLKAEFERNSEMLREGVRQERLRFKQKGA